MNPMNVHRIMANAELRKASEYYEAVQVKPQHVSLKLRISKTRFRRFLHNSKSLTNYFSIPDEAHNLDFFYEQAQDYPVDLYYLMDLSKSMEDDKEKLSALGDLLAATMQNITSNFRLGFGSFVDKVVMPYVSTVPRK